MRKIRKTEAPYRGDLEHEETKGTLTNVMNSMRTTESVHTGGEETQENLSQA
jgi:hypothetical protein